MTKAGSGCIMLLKWLSRAGGLSSVEACFPPIVTDLPAMFGDDMAEYLTEFKAAMPSYAATFNIAAASKRMRVASGMRARWNSDGKPDQV
jgi:hypothetical protein